MSIVPLTNCFVCRQPIAPGTEHKWNRARHDVCVGAGPLNPDPPPPEVAKLFPKVTDAWEIQGIAGLMQERDYYRSEMERHKMIADSITFQHSQLEAANNQIKKLALFYREFFPDEINDPRFSQLSAADFAIAMFRDFEKRITAIESSISVAGAKPKFFRRLFS